MINKAHIDIFPWMDKFWELWTVRVSTQLECCLDFVPGIYTYQLYEFTLFQTLFLKNRIMNRRQFEILIYNDCLYRNMYRLYFHCFLMSIKLSPRVQVHRHHFHFFWRWSNSQRSKYIHFHLLGYWSNSHRFQYIAILDIVFEPHFHFHFVWSFN